MCMSSPSFKTFLNTSTAKPFEWYMSSCFIFFLNRKKQLFRLIFLSKHFVWGVEEEEVFIDSHRDFSSLLLLLTGGYFFSLKKKMGGRFITPLQKVPPSTTFFLSLCCCYCCCISQPVVGYLLLDVDIYFFPLAALFFLSSDITWVSERKAIWKDDMVEKKNHSKNLARWAPFFPFVFFFFFDVLWNTYGKTLSIYQPLKKEKRRKQIDILSYLCVWGLVSLFSRSRRRKDSCKSTTNFCLGNPYLDQAAQSVRPWISIWAWCSSNIYIHTAQDEEEHYENKKKKK